MTVKGCYELVLICDHKYSALDAAHIGTLTCEKTEMFIFSTRMEALATARYDGWLISRDRKTYCPNHAEQRRAEWR